jgi:hypothetical protein
MLVAIAACGTQPARSVDPAPDAQPTAAPTTAATPQASAEGSVKPAEPARKVPAGYRLVKRNGKELYCRSVTSIGSRFAEEMCFTREQIDEIAERTDGAMDDLEQARKTCAGGGHCGG